MFISFEGIDGAGKSTQIANLKNLLQENYEVIMTREPGGTEIGESIRNILKNNSIEPLSEILLLYCARLEHLNRVIKPAIAQGKIVICDRFDHSTIAYQHYGRGIPLEQIFKIKNFTIGDFAPDITFLIDIDLSHRKNRIQKRELDMIENLDEDFHKRVLLGYREIAKNEENVKIINGRQREKDVFEEIKNIIKDILKC